MRCVCDHPRYNRQRYCSNVWAFFVFCSFFSLSSCSPSCSVSLATVAIHDYWDDSNCSDRLPSQMGGHDTAE